MPSRKTSSVVTNFDAERHIANMFSMTMPPRDANRILKHAGITIDNTYMSRNNKQQISEPFLQRECRLSAVNV